jgi:CheY-like chemotaxis protein
MKTASIIIIDDDEDDLKFIDLALTEMQVKNNVIMFDNPTKAFEFMKGMQTNPFLIMCDVNMPIMNGLQLRERINNDIALSKKAVPFLFLSTSGELELVNEAFTLNIQGYFKKPSSLPEYKKMLASIITYWHNSVRPVA